MSELCIYECREYNGKLTKNKTENRKQKTENRQYYPHCYIYKGFKGTSVNRVFNSFIKESVEINSTVSLRNHFL